MYPSPYGQFAAGSGGFLRLAASPATPADPSINVTVNVNGALISDPVALATEVEKALRAKSRLTGRTTAGAR